MTTIVISVFALIMVAVLGYFLWALHNRTENLSLKLSTLTKKVNDGEDVIIENFNIIQKNVSKLENEIAEVQKIEPRLKEIIRTTNRTQRVINSA